MKIVRATKLPITAPGIYRGIDLEVYHSAAVVPPGEYAVSSSDLRTAWSKSMAHAYLNWAHNPERKPRDNGPRHLILGTAAHHLLLGEDKFSTAFIAQPETYIDLTTAKTKPWHNGANYCREWNAKQAKAGKTIVTQDELEVILGMAKSLALEPLVKDGILEGAVECSGLIKDSETGLWIKVRPDVIPTTGGDYVDLKTIADITERGIRRRISDASYHMQGALIWEWSEQMKFNFETFTLAFIESGAPYCARMVPIDDDDLARGRMQNRAMLRKFANCIDKGHWPGPGEGVLRSVWLAAAEREAIDNRLKTENAT